MNGFMGKLLFVNLSDETWEVRDLSENDAIGFLGGYSLGAKVLFDNMPAGVDAFSEESMLGFVAGAMNNSGALMAGRYTVVSKSPVNGKWNDASSGGTFGHFIRSSGFDGIFVKGIASHPVYLLVDNGTCEIKDASHLWGLKTIECEKKMHEELDPTGKGCIALIGPAGEKKALTASIMNDSHRAAGRGGSGAVMGSKNLKAVCCRGKQGLTIADPEGLKALNKAQVEWLANGPTKDIAFGFKNWGTGSATESSVLCGDASVKNWAGAGVVDLDPEDIKKITAAAMDEKWRVKQYGCFACPVRCGAIYEFINHEDITDETGRPEYETVGCFGTQMLNTDAESINVCNFLCNEYGVDTISIGATIAWAMDCYTSGLLTKEQLDGIDLTWGNADAIVEMTKKVVNAEGCGAILVNGSRYASRHWGVGEDLLCEADGIEIAQHDARFTPGLGITYKYDPLPGRHVKGGCGPVSGFVPNEYKYNAKNLADDDYNGVIGNELIDLTGHCTFSGWGVPNLRERLAVVFGDYWKTPEDIDKIGLRSYMMRLAFNQREGFRRKDCYLTPRMRGVEGYTATEGPVAGFDITDQIEEMADTRFERFGINKEDMTIKKETLENLGYMDSVIEQLF